MEAYKVWATLDLKGDATKKMTAFSRSIDRADKLLPKLQSKVNIFAKSLKVIDDTLIKLNPQFKVFIGEFKVLNSALPKANAGFNRLTSVIDATNSTTMFFSSSLERISGELSRVALETKVATDALMDLKRVGNIRTSVGISRAGGAENLAARRLGSNRRISGNRHVPHEIFRELGGAPAKKAAILAGSARFGGPALMGTIALGMASRAGFESSMEYDKSMTQLRAIGLTDEQMNQAQISTQQILPGISFNEQAKSLVDAQMATRNFPAALKLAPPLAKVGYIAKSVFSGLGDDEIKSAVRIAELRGGIAPEDIAKELQAVMHMYAVTAGTMTPSKYLQFFNTYSNASRITPEGLMALEPTMQELKPSKVATALQTMTGKLMGGVKLTKSDAEFFNSIGLFKDGKIKRPYANLLTTDPEAFFEKAWFPLLHKAGITDQLDVSRANLHLGRTSSMLAAGIEKNTGKAALSRQQYKTLLPMDELFDIARESQGGAAVRLSEAASSVATAFGEFSKPGTIAGMNFLSKVLEHMSDVIVHIHDPVNTQKLPNTSGSLWQDMKDLFHHKSGLMKKTSSLDSLTISPNQYQRLAEQFPGAVAGPAATNSKSGDVYLDHQKVGYVMWKNLYDSLNRGGTISTSTGSNSSIAPLPSGINFYGGYN